MNGTAFLDYTLAFIVDSMSYVTKSLNFSII